jgi:hypothetical protein
VLFTSPAVLQVACGDTHTLVCTDSGELYTFGRWAPPGTAQEQQQKQQPAAASVAGAAAAATTLLLIHCVHAVTCSNTAGAHSCSLHAVPAVPSLHLTAATTALRSTRMQATPASRPAPAGTRTASLATATPMTCCHHSAWLGCRCGTDAARRGGWRLYDAWCMLKC